jgi:hypothetical protein
LKIVESREVTWSDSDEWDNGEVEDRPWGDVDLVETMGIEVGEWKTLRLMVGKRSIVVLF